MRGEQKEGCATSNSLGEYLIPLAQSGDYTVRFAGGTCPSGEACGIHWATEYYDDKFSVALADPVHVSSGETSEGIDAAMRTTGERALEEYLENRTPAQPIGGGSGTTPGAIEPLPVNQRLEEEFWARVHAEQSAASQTPGLALAALDVAAAHGAVTANLRCTGSGPCDGVVRLMARLATRRVMRRDDRRVVVRGVRTVLIGSASFSIAARASKTLEIPLSSDGRILLRRAGREGLSVLVSGDDVGQSKVVLHGASTTSRRGHS